MQGLVSQLMASALLVAIVSPPTAPAQVYTSPDRSIRSVIWTGPTRESRAEIQTARKHLLLIRDETSSDGSHGYGVTHAAWTPDSEFFVASAEAAGGHQPWARPIWVYSRDKNRVFELTKMGATAIGDFTMKSPGVIVVKVSDCPNGGGPQPRSLVVSLRRLVTDGGLPVRPCAER